MDEIGELLEEMKPDKVAEWFQNILCGVECNWMTRICHSGNGFSNCNSSTEVHWRNLKESFGEAGKRGLGYSLIRFHGNFMM